MDTNSKIGLGSKNLKLLDKRAVYLDVSSNAVLENSKTLSNYYAYKSAELKRDSVELSTQTTTDAWQYCSFCGHRINPGVLDKVRLYPKKQLNHKLQNLLVTSRKRTGSFQKNYVDRFCKSTNYLKIKCSSCNKISTVPCQSRQDREHQKVKLKQKVAEEVKVQKTRKQNRKKKNKRRIEQMELNDDNCVEGIRIKPTEKSLTLGHKSADAGTSTHHNSLNLTKQNINMYNPSTKDSSLRSRQCPGTTRWSKSETCAMTPSQTILSVLQRGSEGGRNTKKDKKNKTKKSHEQLADMLKAEKKEMTKGSLQDFLSSM